MPAGKRDGATSLPLPIGERVGARGAFASAVSALATSKLPNSMWAPTARPGTLGAGRHAGSMKPKGPRRAWVLHKTMSPKDQGYTRLPAGGTNLGRADLGPA